MTAAPPEAKSLSRDTRIGRKTHVALTDGLLYEVEAYQKRMTELASIEFSRSAALRSLLKYALKHHPVMKRQAGDEAPAKSGG